MSPVPQTYAKKKWPLWLRILIWALVLYLVISLILTFALKGYARTHGGSDVMQAKAKLKTLETLLWIHKHSPGGGYPTQEQGLEALVSKPKNDEEEEKNKERLRDPWQRRFQYRIPGVHHPDGYDLWSNGPDGIEGTEDDVTNW